MLIQKAIYWSLRMQRDISTAFNNMSKHYIMLNMPLVSVSYTKKWTLFPF